MERIEIDQIVKGKQIAIWPKYISIYIYIYINNEFKKKKKKKHFNHHE